MTGFDIRIPTPRRFPIAKGRAKNKVLTSSLSLVGGAYSRTLKAEKSKSQPFHVGGGEVGGWQWLQMTGALALFCYTSIMSIEIKKNK